MSLDRGLSEIIRLVSYSFTLKTLPGALMNVGLCGVI